MTARILMGNEAIGLGLVEAGCRVITSYPGTPASEILKAAVGNSDDSLHAEWSVNEKVAFETAYAAAMLGLRSAVAMKQVGLNVAADPLMRSAYLGVDGGFLVVVADDPGPHSSQTEQDSRFFAWFAKLPVLDPSSPREAREMIAPAFELSEATGLPVVIRPTTRVCHARQAISVAPSPVATRRQASFQRDPRRWCATPAAVRELHGRLNRSIDEISRGEWFSPVLEHDTGAGECIVASGVVAAHLLDLMGGEGPDVWRVRMPFPLHQGWLEELRNRYRRVLVLEETYPVIELQIGRELAVGRLTGDVPGEGELTPEVIAGILRRFSAGKERPAEAPPRAVGKPPTLCAGCGHRPVFYAMRRTFPKGIFPGDIGCYTLGVGIGGVDSCHCMGAGISQAAGMWHSFRVAGQEAPPLVATIGDSTFFHAGIPALMNAVLSGARFVLVILDNATTAMTGHQPTPHAGVGARGEARPAMSIEKMVEACGATYCRTMDAYNIPEMRESLAEAHRLVRDGLQGPAVLIARRPCVLADGRPAAGHRVFEVDGGICNRCGHCVKAFGCPAIALGDACAAVDPAACTGCGACVTVCARGAFRVVGEGASGA
jgi:indolepyruvate ferredoxin oxidoreductase alpha subunit